MNTLITNETPARRVAMYEGTARDIWKELDIKNQYIHWFNDQVERFEFVKGVDYEVFGVNPNNPQGGRPRLDHSLTLSAANKIKAGSRQNMAVIAEKVAEQVTAEQTASTNPLMAALSTIQTMQTALQGAIGTVKMLAETVSEQQEKLEEQKPAVDFVARIEQSEQEYDIGETAKLLNIPSLGRNNLFEWLREKRILMRDNEPYQQYVSSGYMRFTLVERNGYTHVKPLFTTKGITWLTKLMIKEGLLLCD